MQRHLARPQHDIRGRRLVYDKALCHEAVLNSFIQMKQRTLPVRNRQLLRMQPLSVVAVAQRDPRGDCGMRILFRVLQS